MPTAKASQAMTHTDALEGGFLPSMSEEEQKRFTPSELLLYKHALEYRYNELIPVHTFYVRVHTENEQVHTQYISSTCMYIPRMYMYIPLITKYKPSTFKYIL